MRQKKKFNHWYFAPPKVEEKISLRKQWGCGDPRVEMFLPSPGGGLPPAETHLLLVEGTWFAWLGSWGLESLEEEGLVSASADPQRTFTKVVWYGAHRAVCRRVWYLWIQILERLSLRLFGMAHSILVYEGKQLLQHVGMNLPTDLHVTALLKIRWRSSGSIQSFTHCLLLPSPFLQYPSSHFPKQCQILPLSLLHFFSASFLSWKLFLSLWITFHTSCCLFHSLHSLASSAPQLSSDGTAKVAYKTLACTWQLNSNRAGGCTRTWRQATYLHPSVLPCFSPPAYVCVGRKHQPTKPASSFTSISQAGEFLMAGNCDEPCSFWGHSISAENRSLCAKSHPRGAAGRIWQNHLPGACWLGSVLLSAVMQHIYPSWEKFTDSVSGAAAKPIS